MSRRFRTATATLLMGAVLASSGCSVGTLQFQADRRLSFTSPAMRAKVAVPVTLTWTMKDFDPSGLDGSTSTSRGVFAVFVDRSPMPVGKDLRWLFRNDANAKRDPRYLTTTVLNNDGIYLTTVPTLSLTQLPVLPAGVGEEEHTVNVVLLDGTSTRRTESAWFRTFLTKRRETT